MSRVFSRYSPTGSSVARPASRFRTSNCWTRIPTCVRTCRASWPKFDCSIRQSTGPTCNRPPRELDNTKAGTDTLRCPVCQEEVRTGAFTGEEQSTTCVHCGETFVVVGPTVRPREKAGQFVGRFRLLAHAGSGGFGSVWQAYDAELDRIVAIKFPRRSFLSEQERKQFLSEARATAQLRHPHIVPVYETGQDGETVFIVSEFIEGPSLSQEISDRPLPPVDAATLCITLADAVHYAHEQGIIHRDLKPHNVLLDPATRRSGIGGGHF